MGSAVGIMPVLSGWAGEGCDGGGVFRGERQGCASSGTKMGIQSLR